MRISGNFGMSYDPYGNYTDILKKSINMRTDRDADAVSTSVRPVAGDTAVKPSEQSVNDAAVAAVKALEEETAEVKPAERSSRAVSEIAESVPFIRDFETIGRNSDISLLDSDVRFKGAKADAVLSQYQYFVNG